MFDILQLGDIQLNTWLVAFIVFVVVWIAIIALASNILINALTRVVRRLPVR